MWAWNILDIYKQCQEIIDGYNTKAQSKPESKTETDDDLIVDDLLEVHFKVKTKSDKTKMLSWFNFKNSRNRFITLDSSEKDDNGTKLSFSMVCDGYDTCFTDV